MYLFGGAGGFLGVGFLRETVLTFGLSNPGEQDYEAALGFEEVGTVGTEAKKVSRKRVIDCSLLRLRSGLSKFVFVLVKAIGGPNF